MIDQIITILAQRGFAATIDGDTFHVGGYTVSASLTGAVRMSAPNVGTITVSTMKNGASGVAYDILTVLHYAG